LICAVGLEFRDYPTLLEAVRGLPVQVVVAAASPWSQRGDSTAGQAIPPNVHVDRFTQAELRALYACSAFVVMPLYDVEFQAGVTAILEAMAMEKAVVCSRTPGQTDVIVEGETGLYVEPEAPAALREAIMFLLEKPELAREMGAAGRRRVIEEMDLDHYVRRLKAYV
jgi:glycosyltransferase involved in cell wall biosynthesis